MAEEAERGSEQDSLFRLAMTHAGIGMCLVAPDGGLLEVNPALCLMLGRPPEELTAGTWQQLTHPDDLEADAALVAEVLSGQRNTYRLLKRYLRPDGAVVWGDLTVSCIRDDEGRVRSFISQIVDVTEREISRAALAQSEARYRLLAEHSTDVVAQGDNDAVITWISDAITPLLGWSPRQWEGRPIFELLHPDDVEDVTAHHHEVRRGRPAAYDVRMRAADGHFRWVSVRARPVRDEQGTVVGQVGNWRDAEAAHRAQELLAASERRFRLLAENASDVVYETGPDRTITWISPSVVDALGWSPEELRDTRMFDLVHPQDRASVVDPREALFTGGQLAPAQGEARRFRRKDGSWVWMSVHTTPILDERGALACAVVGMRSVDDLVRARQRAEEQHDRLQALLDSSLEPFVLLAAARDRDGRVTDFTFADANPAALEVYGMSRQDLLGTSLLELHPAAISTGLFAMYVAVVDEGRPMILDDWPYPQDILGGRVLRYDMRAVKVGDAVSQTWRDVTQRYESMQRIRESEERYRLLAENSSDVVILLRDGLMQWLSPSLGRMLGWSPEDWTGHAVEEFTHPDDVTAVRRDLRLADGEHATVRVRLRDIADRYHWAEIRASSIAPQRDSGTPGSADAVLVSFRTIDDVVAYEQELKRRARLDDLTGALTRGELLRLLGRLGGDRRRPGEHSAVLFCDIDDFKEINDGLGHAAGDEVLRVVAERLRGVLRDTDLLARMGGDEFLVYLTGIHHMAEAQAIAEKMRSAAAEPIHRPGQEDMHATLSVGVTLRAAGDDADTLIARADQAMYAAKRAGRNRVASVAAP